MSSTLLLLLVLVIALASLAVQVYALVDASSRDDLPGGKTLWVALLAVGLILPGAGTLLALVYLLAIRPQ